MKKLWLFIVLLIAYNVGSAQEYRNSYQENNRTLGLEETDAKIISTHGAKIFMNYHVLVQLEIIGGCRVVNDPHIIDQTLYEKAAQVEFVANVMSDCTDSYPFKVERKDIDKSTITLPHLRKSNALKARADFYKPVAIEF